MVLFVAEVLVGEGTVLAVSGFLVKKVTILHGSVTLAKEEEMVVSSALWLRLGALGAFSLDLVRLGGIGTCLGTSGLCRFASLLLQQPRFHERKCERILMKSC